MIFEFTHANRPVSSWISGIYYNQNTKELVVNAHGNSYIYLDVPQDVFDYFGDGYSAGDTYNSLIRGKYDTKFGKGRQDVTLRPVDIQKENAVEQKKFTVRATVEFEAEVSAGSLDEAVKAFLESNKDVPGIKIKEVVVPFGE
jgi:hypothetical protein